MLDLSKFSGNISIAIILCISESLKPIILSFFNHFFEVVLSEFLCLVRFEVEFSGVCLKSFFYHFFVSLILRRN